MTTVNPFDLLGDNEDDPSQFIAAVQQQKAAAVLQQKKAADAAQQTGKKANGAKFPLKPVAPAQAVRDAKTEGGRGRGVRGYGRERDSGSYNREPAGVPYAYAYNNGSSSEGYVPKPYDDGEWDKKNDRPAYRGPRTPHHHSGLSNGHAAEGEQPRREYERRSSTGYRNELKREGSGRGNWGAHSDEITQVNEEPISENDKSVDAEKAAVEVGSGESKKDNPAAEITEEPKPVDNSMTLKEYEKILEEKKMMMLARKSEERKVVVDKDLESMQPLSSKKTNNEIFAKLGSDKSKTKEVAVKEEKVKKTLSLDISCYQRGQGQGRGRGRDFRGGYPDKFNAPTINGNGHVPRGYPNMPRGAPTVNDEGHFPLLGGQ